MEWFLEPLAPRLGWTRKANNLGGVSGRILPLQGLKIHTLTGELLIR